MFDTLKEAIIAILAWLFNSGYIWWVAAVIVVLSGSYHG